MVVEELIDHVEIDAVVVAVVFANEVVKIRLVQKFIAVDVVEQSSQPDESAG